MLLYTCWVLGLEFMKKEGKRRRSKEGKNYEFFFNSLACMNCLMHMHYGALYVVGFMWRGVYKVRELNWGV